MVNDRHSPSSQERRLRELQKVTSPLSRDDHLVTSPTSSSSHHHHHHHHHGPPTPTSRLKFHRHEHVSGTCRYLKGTDVMNEDLYYDLAIITHRTLPSTRRWPQALFRRSKSTMSTTGSPGSEAVQGQVVETLVDLGLQVDIIDAGLTPTLVKGKGKSEYFVLLITAPESLIRHMSHQLNLNLWLRSGNPRELFNVMNQHPSLPSTAGPTMTPADRIQIIEHLIREEAQMSTETNPWIHSIFPIHCKKINQELLRMSNHNSCLHLFSSLSSAKFIHQMKQYFGEKVAFYFAFLDWYNKSLLVIAIIGLGLSILRSYVDLRTYMMLLLPWGAIVSVLWSFWFLRSWERKNKELNYIWDDKINSKQIQYPNPDFRGTPSTCVVTGRPDTYYPYYRRYPKYLITCLFMCVQIFIMMIFIACWITVFEGLKVRFPDSEIFSVQWFAILGGGIVFGLFVDVFQWNCVVTRVAKLLTKWENWKTIEQYEKALIRKLFVMDFLNYYTWFFLICFAYVIPGVGDRLTNMLNSVLWNDPVNCCFGSYLRSRDACASCPVPWTGASPTTLWCVPCQGPVTFNRRYLDLEQLFVTPIVVTQGLNLCLGVVLPWIGRLVQTQKRRKTDRRALEMMKLKGTRQMLAEMEYREDTPLLTKLSAARYIKNDDHEVEALNALARDVIFQSEQAQYDPYDDYHLATIQYGFVVMFSMLWPLMPLACLLINLIKIKSDSFRLCKVLQRPVPRKSSGIGEWQLVLNILGCVGVLVYVLLIFVSTGVVEFFSSTCVADLERRFGGPEHFRAQFHFGPDFHCFSVSDRVVMILVCEHLIFGLLWLCRQKVRQVPQWLEIDLSRKDFNFKRKLYRSVQRSRRGSASSSSFPHVARKTTPRSPAVVGYSTSSSELHLNLEPTQDPIVEDLPTPNHSSSRRHSVTRKSPKFHAVMSPHSLAQAFDINDED